MNITSAFSKFTITKELYSLLNSNTGLTSYVGENIYPIVAPQKDDSGNEIKECIVYYREKYSKEYIQNNIVVNEIIEGVHQNESGYNYQCRLIDSDENVIGVNNDKYIQVVTFEIK